MSTTPENASTQVAIISTEDKEKLFLRNLVIAICLVALGAFVTVATVVTVLIAKNFNILEWME